MDIQGTDNPIYTMTFSFSFYGPLWSKEVSLNAVILEKCFFFLLLVHFPFLLGKGSGE